MLLVFLHAALASCEVFYDDDLTDGSTDGYDDGGSWSGSGWHPDGGSMVYNFPFPVDRGRFELTLAGLEEAGLSQTDVGEMFSAHDGSFSDGRRLSFLQLKMAGDVYDGYAGRIKMHIGGVHGEMELAEWSDERDWSPADVHVIAVTWGDGRVYMEHDGSVVADVDYSVYNGGYVPFESLRVPNDGRYAYDPVMSELRYLHVRVCGDPGELPDPPVVDLFDVQPRELAQGAAFTLGWSVRGDWSGLQACGRARTSGELLCTPLSGGAGSLAIGSEVLAVDTWDVWLEATGPGGTTPSAAVELRVHEAGWVPSADTGGDTGGDTDGPDDGESGDSGGTDDSDGNPFGDEPGINAPATGAGCACGTAPHRGATPAGLVAMGAMALLAAGRRAGFAARGRGGDCVPHRIERVTSPSPLPGGEGGREAAG
jgi:hypothetical protein